MSATKPRIAILTDLADFSPGYSLVNVILNQCRMLARHGYPYDLFCLKAFNEEDRKRVEAEGIRTKHVLAQTRLIDYRVDEPPHPTVPGKEVGFEDQALVHLHGDRSKGTIGYLEAVKDYDVVITHDLMFLSWFLPQNKAVRDAIDAYPDKNWIHWIHSGPSQKTPGTCYPSTLRYEAAPESTYVFLNESQRADCALMLSTTRSRIAVVYNPRDVRDYFNFSRETCDFIDRYDILNHDLLQTYPFSTPRWNEKGVRHLMKLFGEFKNLGVRARLVLVNANANSPQDVPRVAEIEGYAKRCGLELDRDLILTSRYADEMATRCIAGKDKDAARRWSNFGKGPHGGWRYCVPANVVRDLTIASNIFIFTSKTECCSLIQAEAAVTGKYLVLNRNFRPMLEFAGPDVLSFEFNDNDPDSPKLNPNYYPCVAREILLELKNDAVVNRTDSITRVYNKDWIFRTQLEPLLWRKFKDRKVPQPQLLPAGKPQQPVPSGEVRVEEPRITLEERREDPPAPTACTVDPSTGILAPVQPDPGGSGRPCPIWQECTPEREAKCLAEAGKCMMEGEVPAE
jgi:hypothetical protein